MPRRLERVFAANPIFFLTMCAHQRRKILNQPIVHERFIRFGLHAANYYVSVGRYVIMPDHIHLFAVFGPGSPSVSNWVKSMKNAISNSLKDARIDPPHWQKGFFDHVLRSQESYNLK
jgi:REP element-mobilizing transposase RayT